MHLDRLISVIETIAIAGRPVGAVDLHRATGLPRPTCYRLIATLAEQRLLEEVPNGGFVIGKRLLRIAHLGRADQDICAVSAPVLKEAAVELGEAVFISRFRDPGVEIFHVEMPADPARSFVYPGLGFRPMHACSCSKAIAAFADQSLRDQILARPMRAYTEHTRTEPTSLKLEFEAIRAKGYAECVEEIEIGVASVAAPVMIHDVDAMFSVGATGPIRRFSARYRAEVGAALQDLATRLGQAIGLGGPDIVRNAAVKA